MAVLTQSSQFPAVPKRYVHLEPQTVPLFGIRVFAGVTKDPDMRPSWVRVGPKSNDTSL